MARPRHHLCLLFLWLLRLLPVSAFWAARFRCAALRNTSRRQSCEANDDKLSRNEQSDVLAHHPAIAWSQPRTPLRDAARARSWCRRDRRAAQFASGRQAPPHHRIPGFWTERANSPERFIVFWNGDIARIDNSFRAPKCRECSRCGNILALRYRNSFFGAVPQISTRRGCGSESQARRLDQLPVSSFSSNGSPNDPR